MSAEPMTCRKCSTVTWTRNRFVFRCRYCGLMNTIPQESPIVCRPDDVDESAGMREAADDA